MEKPYQGRAIFKDHFTHQEIIFPVKRNWLYIIFMSLWLCFWLAGEITVLREFHGAFGVTMIGTFFLFWLLGWTFSGLFCFQHLYWNLFGREIFIIGQGQMSIEKKGLFFYKTKTYNLNEVKNIRVQYNITDEDDYSPFNRNIFGFQFVKGIILFDYGLRTIQFGNSIDEAEGNFIIKLLKEKHLLTEKNFG